jgi:excinuclease ABC subunit A
MVPNDRLTIRERAIAAWPTAWQGQNLREILMTLGYDVDTPWRDLPKKDRDWILFTDEQPTVPVYSGFTAEEMKRALKQKMEPSYMGTFTGARKYVMQTFANTQSALMKKRVSQYMLSSECPLCGGKRLRRESLSVRFAGMDITELSRVPLARLHELFASYAEERGQAGGRQGSSSGQKGGQAGGGQGGDSGHEGRSGHEGGGREDAGGPRKGKTSAADAAHPEKVIVTQRITQDIRARLQVMLDLGLGYLTIERGTPTLSPGELQRLRLATQVRSNLFGVVYVLDEPSAGLHPADTEALLRALDRLKASGNSLFVVEHEVDVIRHADWIVDVGPGAGSGGGEILYSGVPEGLRLVERSVTRKYLYGEEPAGANGDGPGRANGGEGIEAHRKGKARVYRKPKGWLKLEEVTRNNLDQLDASFPLGVFTTVTGVSGSGKSSLVSQALVELVAEHLGQEIETTPDEGINPLEQSEPATLGGKIVDGMPAIKRLVTVDQKAIGRTPRSNLATYTGLFDHVRKIFASTKMAKARKYDAGSFSFNVAKGRCPHCLGEGFVMVELLFLPSVYAPCPTCNGTRYNKKILDVTYKEKNIAEVLNMTVDEAWAFFADDAPVYHTLDTVRQVGLGYLRLGQAATELSGGEAQRIKLATELQRTQHGNSLYILDEPTTGLHPSDVEKLMAQLNGLVASGNTVIVVEHDMQVIAASDWVIDIGPGAGEEGGKIVAAGTPAQVAESKDSRTAKYLALAMA